MKKLSLVGSFFSALSSLFSVYVAWAPEYSFFQIQIERKK